MARDIDDSDRYYAELEYFLNTGKKLETPFKTLVDKAYQLAAEDKQRKIETRQLLRPKYRRPIQGRSPLVILYEILHEENHNADALPWRVF